MKAITVRYLCPTSFKGSRVKATDGDGNAVVLPYNDEVSREDAYDQAARALCAKMGWTGHDLVRGWYEGNAYYVFLATDSVVKIAR